MHRHVRLIGAPTLAVLVAVAAARCTDGAPPVSPNDSVVQEVRLSAEQAQASLDGSDLPHGRPTVRWMAEVHTAAMQEATAHRRQWAALGRTARCARIEGLVRRHVPAVVAHTGVNDAVFFEAAIAGARARIGCGSPGPLAIWGVPRLALSTASTDTVVTGAYQDYAAALETAMAVDGTPAEIADALDRVLVKASGINPSDYEVLAGLAALGASSAYYWYEYELAGGFDDGGSGGNEDEPAAMAIFRSNCRFWCKVGAADLVGSLAGAAGAVYSGAAVVPQTVLAAAAIGGIASSVSAMM